MASDGNRERATLFWAAKHPLRIRILECAERERATASLSASDLKVALQHDVMGLTTSQVAYHLAQLRDAGLLARPGQGGPSNVGGDEE